MLPKSKKNKGKLLEKYVAERLKEIDRFAYRRADSGSGKNRKEDVFTTLPFFIECKNQAELNINQWWKETIDGCPKDKYPVLIYKINYQKVPTVYLRFEDLISFISNKKVEIYLNFNVSLSFDDFINLVKNVWNSYQQK